jgi:hypothetical protein
LKEVLNTVDQVFSTNGELVIRCSDVERGLVLVGSVIHPLSISCFFKPSLHRIVLGYLADATGLGGAGSGWLPPADTLQTATAAYVSTRKPSQS